MDSPCTPCPSTTAPRPFWNPILLHRRHFLYRRPHQLKSDPNGDQIKRDDEDFFGFIGS
jgi:hypothetical protein